MRLNFSNTQIVSYLFFFTYFLFAFVVLIIGSPFVLIRSFYKKYTKALPARFFLTNNSRFVNDGIWFHACSMGEVKALEPLIRDKNSSISVITNTGYEQAKKFTTDVRFLPFELFLPFWVGKHSTLVVMEAELWYMLFFVARYKKIRTILINARISDKSVERYNKFRFFYKFIFKNIDFVFCQTYLDQERLVYLGAKNVVISGNIKLANMPTLTRQYIKPKKFLLVCASTHFMEEEIILDALKNAPEISVAFAPRHPERFDSVEQLLKDFCFKQGLSYGRYSKTQSLEDDIVLFDMIGELVNLFAVSDAVILGGAFEKKGGHNPIEPAFFGSIIISGKHIFNQKALFECIENCYFASPQELPLLIYNIKKLKKTSLKKNNTIEQILEVLYDRKSI